MNVSDIIVASDQLWPNSTNITELHTKHHALHVNALAKVLE